MQQTEQANQYDPNFGDWMLVTRKKNPIRTGQNRGTNLPHQQLNTFPKENKGKEGNSNTLTLVNPDLTFQFKVGPPFRAVGASEDPKATLTSQKFGEIFTQANHGESRKAKLDFNSSLSNYDLGSPLPKQPAMGIRK